MMWRCHGNFIPRSTVVAVGTTPGTTLVPIQLVDQLVDIAELYLDKRGQCLLCPSSGSLVL